MNENMNDGTAKATARRRLIRGAFGAPAALTLYSGSVFAQSSSSRALRNQFAVGNAQWPGPVEGKDLSPTDTWIRVQVYKGNGNVNGDTKVSANVLIVSGAEVAAKPGCGINGFTGTTGWATLNGSAPFTPNNNPAPELTSPILFAALRYNQSGQIIGVIPATNDQTGGGSALTKSAGGSLVVGACVL